MRTPAPDELLDAWDAGTALPATQRTVPLLHAAGAFEGTDQNPLELSLGEQQRLLIALREQLFGPVLSARAGCPGCGVVLELTVLTSELLAAEASSEQLGVRAGGYVVRCRPLRAGDLADAAATGSAEAARALLVKRAVLAAECDGQPVPADALPVEVVGAVAAALSEAEPLAVVELPIECDACAAVWLSPLDVGSFLWDEIDTWAGRLLAEVHTLAQAYGWSERQVLGLSARRRRRYLELVADG